MWTKQIILSLCVLNCVWMYSLAGQEIATRPIDDHQYAQLGIEVTDSPGVGVQVGVVAVDGPADHGGIRPGDFIMAINGNSIDKTDDLVAAIREQKPGAEVVVRVWRDGKESEQKIILATASDADHRTDRAWLGVTLEANGTIGAKIGQVIPGSPAAKAKLKSGDVIVAINETKIESAKQLVDAIESYQSGDKVTLTLAGDAEVRREVTLEKVTSAPPIFNYRLPIPELDEWLHDSFTPPPSWREEMSDLRRQLQELREAIRDKGKDIMDLDDEGDTKQRDPSSPQTDDASILEPEDAVFQLVDYRYDRSSNQNRVYRYRPAYPYSHYYRPSDGYWYYYGPRPIPYSSYYGGFPLYQPYYPPYYRPGVRVYIGPLGFEYYYR